MGKNIICNIFWKKKKEQKKKELLKIILDFFILFFTIFIKNIQIKHEF